MSEWQPIESAPMTGEDILVYAGDSQFVVFWSIELSRFVFAMNDQAVFALDSAECWMPLPPSPQPKGNEFISECADADGLLASMIDAVIQPKKVA